LGLVGAETQFRVPHLGQRSAQAGFLLRTEKGGVLSTIVLVRHRRNKFFHIHRYFRPLFPVFMVMALVAMVVMAIVMLVPTMVMSLMSVVMAAVPADAFFG